jgi:hypothetical protein
LSITRIPGELDLEKGPGARVGLGDRGLAVNRRVFHSQVLPSSWMGRRESQDRRRLRSRALILLFSAPALWGAVAAAEPGSGPRETVDQRFTTSLAGAPTGIRYDADYHAGGDPEGKPPYMRRMVVHPPRGLRYDTSVPGRCTAGDAELQLRGPEACPDASRIGRGNIEGVFEVPFGGDAEFHSFRHRMYVLNNTNEQVVLVESEGFTVIRGRIRDDGAIVWKPATCFPSPPGGACVDDYIVQLGTTTNLKPYTRRTGRRLRSYVTTPPRCPARGFWQTMVRFWWSDGSVDRVRTKQPCRGS